MPFYHVSFEGNSHAESVWKDLKAAAWRASRPFCHWDGLLPEGETYCPKCGSDDTERWHEDVGHEWGTDHIVEHWVLESMNSFDHRESYKDMLEGETNGQVVTVAGFNVDASEIIEKCVDWEYNADNFHSEQISDGEWVEIGGNTYATRDLEDLLEDKEIDYPEPDEDEDEEDDE